MRRLLKPRMGAIRLSRGAKSVGRGFNPDQMWISLMDIISVLMDERQACGGFMERMDGHHAGWALNTGRCYVE